MRVFLLPPPPRLIAAVSPFSVGDDMRLQGPDVHPGRQLAPLPGALRPHVLYALHVRRGASAAQVVRNTPPCHFHIGPSLPTPIDGLTFAIDHDHSPLLSVNQLKQLKVLSHLSSLSQPPAGSLYVCVCAQSCF